ncbi:MAG: hypothetical protein ACKE5M_02210 [Methylophilaceae bacterium]
MKRLLIIALVAFCTACSSVGDVAKKSESSTIATHKQKPGRTLPIEERAFVKAIEALNKKEIITQLGEPAKADDVKVKGSSKVVASIWHYHYVNTDENGKYFETTELDFIDDTVVQVVFLNNDGSEEAKSKDPAYEVPKKEPSN